MTIFQIIAFLISLTALFGYLNHRYFKFPTTIGVMLFALVLSLGLIGLGELGWGLRQVAAQLLARIDFNRTLLEGMLSLLLFAGALHVDFNDLAKQRYIITILATAGVLASTFIIGSGFHLLMKVLGIELPFILCLLFGALISPTDPIAVLGILKSAGVGKSLEIKVTGESLFNDGIGVVVFLSLFEIAFSGHGVSLTHIASLFVLEAVGGALFGIFLGWLAYRMLKSIDNYQMEVLITLALATGGYALASALHTSGPIAIVVAGLFIGNHGRDFAMSDKTREHLDTFWELLDEILNAVLFVLIGLEVLVLSFQGAYLLSGLAAIPLVLLSRYISVVIPVTILSRWRAFSPGAVAIMTWGGLRGGISVALALSLPASPQRDLLLATTYMVVVFSILIQGLSLKKLAFAVVRHGKA